MSSRPIQPLIGVGHNRWFVIEVAQGLVQGKKAPAERIALVARLEGVDDWSRHQLGGSIKLPPLIPPCCRCSSQTLRKNNRKDARRWRSILPARERTPGTLLGLFG